MKRLLNSKLKLFQLTNVLRILRRFKDIPDFAGIFPRKAPSIGVHVAMHLRFQASFIVRILSEAYHTKEPINNCVSVAKVQLKNKTT